MRSLSGLRCFIEVANAGSFAGAARQLGLSTSAVSKAVSRLELELGVRLLHRTTRRVSLTPEGERARDAAAAPVGELEALAAELSDTISAPRGLVRMSVPAAWGRTWLVPRLPQFMESHPQLRLDLSLADRAVELVGDRVDLLVRTGPIPDSQSIVARRLFVEPMITCASPDYLTLHGTPECPADLHRHNCLDHRTQFSGRQYPWRFSVEGAIVEWPHSGRITIDDGESVARAAQVGLGVSQMPLFLAEEALATGRLVEILKPFRPSPMVHTALYANRRFVSPRLRAVLDFLVAQSRGRER